MPELEITNIDNADDDEVAACVAAISLILQDEQRASAQPQQADRLSGWRLASLLEASGRAKRIVARDQLTAANPWTAGLRSLNIVIAGLMAVAVACCAMTPAVAHDSPGAPEPGISAAEPQWPVTSAPATTAPPMVRVALACNKDEGQVSLPNGGILTDFTNGDVLAQLPARSRWQVQFGLHGGIGQLCFSGSFENGADSTVYIATRSDYRNVAFVSGAVPDQTRMSPIPAGAPARFWLPAMRSTADGGAARGRTYLLSPSGANPIFALAGKQYRGSLLISPRGNGVDFINQIDVEEYLQSVVPAEMPSSWPLEALKSQAIAARSYVIANLGKHGSDGYDVKATTDDQVYAGTACETDSTNQAVAETRGVVLRHQGQVITAYFHSASGGCTELAENVWSRPLPFLKAVPDYDDQSPFFSWNKPWNSAAIEQALSRSGKSVGNILSIMPIARGASPRVRWLLICGSDRTLLLSGEEVRRLFALPSSCFNVGANGDSYVFAGRGFGHGLGMSQWGAKRLAELGFTAADILNYYYKDVTIERL